MRTLSLIASVRAVAVGKEEDTRRERAEAEVSLEAFILCVWRHLTVLCDINKLLRNIDHRW